MFARQIPGTGDKRAGQRALWQGSNRRVSVGNCRAEVNEKTAFPGGTGDPWKVPEKGRTCSESGHAVVGQVCVVIWLGDLTLPWTAVASSIK